DVLSLRHGKRPSRAAAECWSNPSARQQHSANTAVRLVKSAPNLMQRLSCLPAAPNVTLLDRRKPKPHPSSHANTTFTEQIYIRWCCIDLSNAPRYSVLEHVSADLACSGQPKSWLHAPRSLAILHCLPFSDLHFVHDRYDEEQIHNGGKLAYSEAPTLL